MTDLFAHVAEICRERRWPHWRGGDAMLVCADCLELLPLLPDACVDAVVADPPYGVNNDCAYNARGLGERTGKHWPARDWPNLAGDNQPFDPSPFLKFPAVILWGGNCFAERLPQSGWLIWDKERPDELDQSTCEVAWISFRKGIRRFRHLWNGLCRASEVGEHLHPTQKPVALMEWCLGFLPKARTILDPYMGSCPVGVACLRLGRRFLGCEIERRWFDVAVKRCEAELARYPLIQEKPAVQTELFTE